MLAASGAAGSPDSGPPTAATALRRAASTFAPWLLVLAAAALILPGLGDYGLWSEVEVAAADRVRAARGAALAGLVRAPALPDALRVAIVGAREGVAPLAAWLPLEAALRLPGALAAIATAGLVAALIRTLDPRPLTAWLAAAIVLACPTFALGARTLGADAIGELAAIAATFASVRAFAAASAARATGWSALALVAITAGTASSGLLWGAAAPLLGAIALSPSAAAHPRARGFRRTRALVGAAGLALAGVAIVLAVRQGDGYIPLVGAAKDPEVLARAHARSFTSGLEAIGFATYPWLPLALVGALLSPVRARLGAWVALVWALGAGWGLTFGHAPAHVVAPTAIAAAIGARALFASDAPVGARRLGLTLALFGVLVLAKDAVRTPERLLIPWSIGPDAVTIDAAFVGAGPTAAALGRAIVLALMLAAIIGWALGGWALGRPRTRVPAWIARLEPSAVACALLLVAASAEAIVLHRVVLPRAAAAHSVRTAVELLPAGATLLAYRVRDAGVPWFAPTAAPEREAEQLLAAFAAPAPTWALVRRDDLPVLHDGHRRQGFPLTIVDDRHAHLLLATNAAPPGVADRNPLRAIVHDDVPPGFEPTSVRFGDHLLVRGYRLERPLRRGRPARLELAIEVDGPTPPGLEIHTRIVRGRSSRAILYPDLRATDGAYPPRWWRKGDVIVHAIDFTPPTLELVPGAHEIVIGMRRGEGMPLSVTRPITAPDASSSAPEEPDSPSSAPFGVRVRGGKREFAVIGQVDVW